MSQTLTIKLSAVFEFNGRQKTFGGSANENASVAKTKVWTQIFLCCICHVLEGTSVKCVSVLCNATC